MARPKTRERIMTDLRSEPWRPWRPSEAMKKFTWNESTMRSLFVMARPEHDLIRSWSADQFGVRTPHAYSLLHVTLDEGIKRNTLDAVAVQLVWWWQHWLLAQARRAPRYRGPPLWDGSPSVFIPLSRTWSRAQMPHEDRELLTRAVACLTGAERKRALRRTPGITAAGILRQWKRGGAELSTANRMDYFRETYKKRGIPWVDAQF